MFLSCSYLLFARCDAKIYFCTAKRHFCIFIFSAKRHLVLRTAVQKWLDALQKAIFASHLTSKNSFLHVKCYKCCVCCFLQSQKESLAKNKDALQKCLFAQHFGNAYIFQRKMFSNCFVFCKAFFLVFFTKQKTKKSRTPNMPLHFLFTVFWHLHTHHASSGQLFKLRKIKKGIFSVFTMYAFILRKCTKNFFFRFCLHKFDTL